MAYGSVTRRWGGGLPALDSLREHPGVVDPFSGFLNAGEAKQVSPGLGAARLAILAEVDEVVTGQEIPSLLETEPADVGIVPGVEAEPVEIAKDLLWML